MSRYGLSRVTRMLSKLTFLPLFNRLPTLNDVHFAPWKLPIRCEHSDLLSLPTNHLLTFLSLWQKQKVPLPQQPSLPWDVLYSITQDRYLHPLQPLRSSTISSSSSLDLVSRRRPSSKGSGRSRRTYMSSSTAFPCPRTTHLVSLPAVR